MIALHASFWNRFVVGKPASVAHAPQKRRPAPVFIHDAITPWRDETMLLRLLRDSAAEDPDQS